MKAWLTTVTLGIALAAAAPAAAQDAPPDSLALARQYTAWLYAGEADSLLAHSTEETRAKFSEPPGYGQMTETIASRAGTEVEVLEETWKLRNGACQYWRTARFTSMGDQALLIRWVLDPDGRISGLGIGPLSQAPAIQSQTCGPALDVE